MKASVLTIFLCLAVTAHAQVPSTFSYQGYIADASGAPLDETASMTFVLYNVPTGGVSLWAMAQDVPVSQGLFSVALGGEGAALPPQVFDGSVFLEIIVNGETLQPRRPLHTSPFAFKARDADTIGGFTAEELDLSDEIAQIQTTLGEIKALPFALIDPIPSVSGSFQFAGGTVEFSVLEGQRLFGTVTLPIAMANGMSSDNVLIGLCLQSVSGGFVSEMTGTSMRVDVNDVVRPLGFSAASLPLPAGTYRVGGCVYNDTGLTISRNDLAAGWFVKSN